MKIKSILFLGVGVMVFLVLGTVSASAQASTAGSITGTVRDPQGAAAANAVITLTGSRLARPYTAPADSSGAIRLTGLAPGTYTVRAQSADGSQSSEPKNVNVRAGKTTSLTITLRLRE